ncbi:MAG TPA: hypothetical protein VF731_00865 [Solirubrobacterales bacterium]
MGRRVRLAIALGVALGALSFAPAAASACASLAGVHSFTGHAYISFSGTASGPIEGTNSSETISLRRTGASLELKLNHRTRGKGKFAGVYFFSGKVRGGNVSVEDEESFMEGGSTTSSGRETYQGPSLPPFGSATVVLDTTHCRYAVTAGVGAKTAFSGDAALRSGDTASVSATSDHEKIPADLHLIGGVGPNAYLTCPGDPLISGQPCVQFAGDWAVDFAELSQCGSFPPQGNCASDEKPAGDGKFLWALKPH